MVDVAARLDRGELSAVASTVTLTEVLVHPFRQGRQDLVTAYRTLLEHHPHLRIAPISAAVAVLAANLRARHGIRTPDALQLSAAIDAGCEAFLTTDVRLKRVDEIRVVLVGELVAG